MPWNSLSKSEVGSCFECWMLNIDETRHLIEAAPPCWGVALIEASSWSPPATAAPPSWGVFKQRPLTLLPSTILKVSLYHCPAIQTMKWSKSAVITVPSSTSQHVGFFARQLSSWYVLVRTIHRPLRSDDNDHKWVMGCGYDYGLCPRGICSMAKTLLQDKFNVFNVFTFMDWIILD